MTKHFQHSLAFPIRARDALLDAVASTIDEGATEIRLFPRNEETEALAQALQDRVPKNILVHPVSDELLVSKAADAGSAPSTTYVLLPERDDDLPQLLQEFVDWDGGWLVAPQTARYSGRMPLFVVSIPKAGTHLLYELARRMGYQDGVEFTDFAKPAHWYCLEYTNSHTVASDFFVDSVRRAPFGNRSHPFPTTPTLFIYRNPLDILVSEANYYHKDGKTIFSGYLSQGSPEHRIDRLIDDPWLLGSIRQRVGRFLPWLEFPNVIPVSYEELVGTRGGGDDTVRSRLIWSLQLKLHVAGVPEQIADNLFDEDSPTFHKGKIGSYKRALSAATFDRVLALGQDYMSLFGYPGCTGEAAPFPPCRAEEFRHRPLALGKVDHSLTALTVDSYMDCNLVRYNHRYLAVPQHLGELDFTELEPSRIAGFVSGRTLEELKTVLALGRSEYECARIRATQLKQPQLLNETYADFNLVSYAGNVWAIERSAGRLDFTNAAEVQSWLADEKLLKAASLVGIRAAVDSLLGRRKLQAALSAVDDRTGKSAEHVLKLANKGIADSKEQLEIQHDELGKQLRSISDRVDIQVAQLNQRNEAQRNELAASMDGAKARLEGEISRLAARLDSGLADTLKFGEERASRGEARLVDVRRELENEWKHALESATDDLSRRIGDWVASSGSRIDKLAGDVSTLATLTAALQDGLEQQIATLQSSQLAANRNFTQALEEASGATRSRIDELAGTLGQEMEALSRIAIANQTTTDKLGRDLQELETGFEASKLDTAAAFARHDEFNAVMARNPLVRLGQSLRRIFGKN